MVALELEGISPKGGRHQSIGGYTKDCEKYANALTLGWKVLRVTYRQVESGQVFDWLSALLLNADRRLAA